MASIVQPQDPGVRMIPQEFVHTETTVTEGTNNKKHYLYLDIWVKMQLELLQLNLGSALPEVLVRHVSHVRLVKPNKRI